LERVAVRGREMTLSFPPFTRAVIWLLGINTAVFLFLRAFGSASLLVWVYDNLGLVPRTAVFHGEVWQVVTYSFVHYDFWHWFGNMLGIWMFGSTFESSWGTRRFLELFFTGVVGAALATVLLSFAHILSTPNTVTIGASGGVFAVLMAFGLVFGENEIMMIPFPFLIKAKYFVLILIVVTVAFAISGGGSTAYLAHLGGLLTGYLYVKFAPSRGMTQKFSPSEWYYGMNNSYYRWKRRRAARKFEVYMKQHDRKVEFDEQGNYIPPDDDPRKGNGGGKSGWVN
jgi:membrane associated rhomboid family serine protease